jgi:hypothetical protein
VLPVAHHLKSACKLKNSGNIYFLLPFFNITGTGTFKLFLNFLMFLLLVFLVTGPVPSKQKDQNLE